MSSLDNNTGIVTMKKYKESDGSRILHTFRLNIPEFFAAQEEKDFLDYLESYSGNYFSIRVHGVIVGGAGYKVDSDSAIASISWIFLHPHYTGQGIGKQVVNFLINKMRSYESIKTLRVETSQHGYEFFGSFGFTTVEKKKEYWGKGLDLYRMEMSMSQISGQNPMV